jgi:phosphoribosylaminoimidazolecarboxamide formyltransferase/IMP cyclohydrolase
MEGKAFCLPVIPLLPKVGLLSMLQVYGRQALGEGERMALNRVRDVDNRVAVRRVLMSVSDKSGLDVLVPGLLETCPNVVIYSTGGTFAAVRDMLDPAVAARHLVAVSEYTGQPEMQGGLVKTLDFKIYLGLLSETYNEAHRQDLSRVGAEPIDMVVVNLYPFSQTVARAGVTPEDARTNIDIGGPCMVRAAAKNYLRVASVTDPADYAALLEELRRTGGTLGFGTRLRLMKKAFAHTAGYDQAIAAFFADVAEPDARSAYEVRDRL